MHTPVKGMVQIDKASSGGECRDAGGRDSPIKFLFLAAVFTDDTDNPMRVKLSPVSGCMSKAVTDCARQSLVPGCELPRSAGSAG